MAGGTVTGEWDAVGEADIVSALGHDAKLRRRVHVTAFRDDAPALLAAMDVVALPSWREGFGMALAEAGAMGLPVVGTSTPGGKQAIVHGQTGLLVPLRRPDLLAGALAAVLSQPRLARRLGAAGRLRAQTDFAQAQSIARQLAVYRRLLPSIGPEPLVAACSCSAGFTGANRCIQAHMRLTVGSLLRCADHFRSPQPISGGNFLGPLFAQSASQSPLGCSP